MIRSICLAFLFLGCSLSSPMSTASTDNDFITLYVPMLVATLDCEQDQFESCLNPVGCRRINGLWDGEICVAKSLARLNTELMAGKWYLVSSFENGDFFNFIEFQANTLEAIAGSPDFFLSGKAHDSETFDDPDANDALVSYDSSNTDWFILDYWGRDIGTVSSIEINRVSDNLFTGCEFFLNYPDLTYQDGVCNPVRMTRGGFFKQAERPRLLERAPSSQKRLSRQAREAGAGFRSQAQRINK